MTIETFSPTILSRARLFVALRDLDFNDTTVWRRTPAGDELWEDAHIVRMDNGQLVVWFDNPVTYSVNLSAVAKAGGREEVINLNAFERLLPYWFVTPDTDVESVGAFVFCRSVPIVDGTQEWRCDNTLYGSRIYPLPDDDSPRVTTGAHSIEVYEPVLSVNGVGHLVYTKMRDDAEMRRTLLYDASVPMGGFTLGEVFKVMHEWSQTVGEPFNCADLIANDCATWLSTLGFDASLVDNQPAMQVAKYLSGDTHARARATDIAPDKPELRRFVMERMAYSSLSALCVLHAGIADKEMVHREEERQLRLGIERFRTYYNVPTSMPLTDVDGIGAYVLSQDTRAVGVDGWVKSQLRFLLNKREMLNRVQNDEI